MKSNYMNVEPILIKEGIECQNVYFRYDQNQINLCS